MTLKEFLKTRTFRVNALAALGITIFLILFIIVFLRIYTNHGESIKIPDLKGKTAQEAANLLALHDLRYEITDSVYSSETAPGTVLDQYPKSGMKVKENRIIFLTLCALNQEMIPMPQLTDISSRQAINLIENSGLVAGEIQYRLSEFPNLVLEQKINGKIVAQGEMVPKGSTVDLVLGSESDGTATAVPLLNGRTLENAQLLLEESFLMLGTVNYDESITSEEQKAQGVIWKQSPDPDEVFEVISGTAIDVWLTVDPAKVQENTEAENPENSFF